MNDFQLLCAAYSYTFEHAYGSMGCLETIGSITSSQLYCNMVWINFWIQDYQVWMNELFTE